MRPSSERNIVIEDFFGERVMLPERKDGSRTRNESLALGCDDMVFNPKAQSPFNSDTAHSMLVVGQHRATDKVWVKNKDKI
jgi:hypothetical protein